MNYVSESDFCTNKKQYYPMMVKIINNNLRYVCDKEEIESIANEILFDSMRFFQDKGFKFSTYLSKACRNKSIQILGKIVQKNKSEKRTQIENHTSKDTHELIELKDVMDKLKEIDINLYNVLIDSYINGMNNVEIGKKNGYCPENARKKIQKALKICQEMVYD